MTELIDERTATGRRPDHLRPRRRLRHRRPRPRQALRRQRRPRRHRHRGARRHRDRRARPQRRRQDDRGAHPHDAHRRHRGDGDRRRLRRRHRTRGEVRRRIGLAAQDATVDPLLTGRENLVMLGELHQLSRKEAGRRAVELLEQFSLTDAADRVVSGYSGGMRRRLDLAATLVARPRCCSSTSRPPVSTRGRAPSCGTCSTRSSTAAPRCC